MFEIERQASFHRFVGIPIGAVFGGIERDERNVALVNIEKMARGAVGEENGQSTRGHWERLRRLVYSSYSTRILVPC